MKSLIIFIYLTTLCLTSEAQVVYDKASGKVSEPVDTYRRWRTDLLECDSVKQDMQGDLDDKDSIITSVKAQNAFDPWGTPTLARRPKELHLFDCH